MSDSRHKRKYPGGPRREMTAAWKQTVRDALRNNKRHGRAPSDQSQLAAAIGVHKTAISKMFQADSSALVDKICSVLGISAPTYAANTDDDLDGEVAKLGPAGRAKLLRFIRDFIL